MHLKEEVNAPNYLNDPSTGVKEEGEISTGVIGTWKPSV